MGTVELGLVAPATNHCLCLRSCATLTLADADDRHLPTRIELTSLVGTGRSAPAIDTTAFPDTPSQFFWTSTAWAADAARPCLDHQLLRPHDPSTGTPARRSPTRRRV